MKVLVRLQRSEAGFPKILRSSWRRAASSRAKIIQVEQTECLCTGSRDHLLDGAGLENPRSPLFSGMYMDEHAGSWVMMQDAIIISQVTVDWPNPRGLSRPGHI